METLKQRLKRHEGLALTPYRDDNGNWTVGHGHRIGQGSCAVSAHIADELLEEDIHRVTFEYLSLGWELDDVRRDVIKEMIFWFGLRGFMRFKKMIAAIEKEDFETATDEMLDSQAGRRYRTRMSELATLMRVG